METREYRSTDCRCSPSAWRGCLGIVVSLVVMLTAPATASAFAFHQEEARDWVQAHFDDTLYAQSYYNKTCTCLASLAYRKGAGVPFRHNGYLDREAFWSNPDDWGSNVSLINFSPSWVNVEEFRNHFNDYPPASNDWVRQTLHRCYVAPQEDDRWAGGYIAFYHYSVDKDPYGACANDYFHVGVIYARHQQSMYGNHPIGTCKVDHNDDYTYLLPNLINLGDGRYTQTERRQRFVQVNTLVYIP